MTSHYLEQPVITLDEARTMLTDRLARGGHTAVRRERLKRMIAQLTDQIAIRDAARDPIVLPSEQRGWV
jgi:hypothetical protein